MGEISRYQWDRKGWESGRERGDEREYISYIDDRLNSIEVVVVFCNGLISCADSGGGSLLGVSPPSVAY